MSVTFKTSRDVEEDTSFIAMQAWFGEINLAIPPQKYYIRFSKQLINDKVTLTVKLPLKTQESSKYQEVEIPVDHFSAMKFTDRNASECPESERLKKADERDAPEHPVGLIFCLNKRGEAFIRDKASDMWQQWEDHYNAYPHREELKTPDLMYCLDPSQILMSENKIVLYDADYTECIDQFQAVYCTVWAEHLSEHHNENVALASTIINMSGPQFLNYYYKRGLRVTVSGRTPLYGKPKSIRVFRFDKKVLVTPIEKKEPEKKSPQKVEKKEGGGEEKNKKEKKEDKKEVKKEVKKEEKKEVKKERKSLRNEEKVEKKAQKTSTPAKKEEKKAPKRERTVVEKNDKNKKKKKAQKSQEPSDSSSEEPEDNNSDSD